MTLQALLIQQMIMYIRSFLIILIRGKLRYYFNTNGLFYYACSSLSILSKCFPHIILRIISSLSVNDPVIVLHESFAIIIAETSHIVLQATLNANTFMSLLLCSLLDKSIYSHLTLLHNVVISLITSSSSSEDVLSIEITSSLSLSIPGVFAISSDNAIILANGFLTL